MSNQKHEELSRQLSQEASQGVGEALNNTPGSWKQIAKNLSGLGLQELNLSGLRSNRYDQVRFGALACLLQELGIKKLDFSRCGVGTLSVRSLTHLGEMICFSGITHIDLRENELSELPFRHWKKLCDYIRSSQLVSVMIEGNKLNPLRKSQIEKLLRENQNLARGVSSSKARQKFSLEDQAVAAAIALSKADQRSNGHQSSEAAELAKAIALSKAEQKPNGHQPREDAELARVIALSKAEQKPNGHQSSEAAELEKAIALSQAPKKLSRSKLLEKKALEMALRASRLAEKKRNSIEDQVLCDDKGEIYNALQVSGDGDCAIRALYKKPKMDVSIYRQHLAQQMLLKLEDNEGAIELTKLCPDILRALYECVDRKNSFIDYIAVKEVKMLVRQCIRDPKNIDRNDETMKLLASSKVVVKAFIQGYINKKGTWLGHETLLCIAKLNKFNLTIWETRSGENGKTPIRIARNLLTKELYQYQDKGNKETKQILFLNNNHYVILERQAQPAQALQAVPVPQAVQDDEEENPPPRPSD